MSKDLLERIEELREEIAQATPEERAALLEHLEEAVLTLDAKGIDAPAWARQRLADRIDEEVEDQFDNMPL